MEGDPDSSRVRLLDADPELVRFLSDHELEEARHMRVPVVELEKGPFDSEALAHEAEFGLLMVDGMLLGSLQVGDRMALRFAAPGDLLTPAATSKSMLLSGFGWQAAGQVRVALLGQEAQAAMRRWPGLLAGFQVRMSEQSERLAIQLAICQLPRVDERLLFLMWLMAESWGKVTSAGTTLPVALTHDALGGLVGARRPTVTLALRELTERGAILRQDRGWLLLEGPPQPTGIIPALENPAAVLADRHSAWAAHRPDEEKLDVDPYAELRETVTRLRREHAAVRQAVRTRLDSVLRERERCEELRARVKSRRERAATASRGAGLGVSPNGSV